MFQQKILFLSEDKIQNFLLLSLSSFQGTNCRISDKNMSLPQPFDSFNTKMLEVYIVILANKYYPLGDAHSAPND
ncbi:hypothetical protein D3P07_26685 [Paenibacillus sp. 1011MAR3C5]|nr:hypothetical protein D3P07_26685 [Paenibacillus sp. 1011MAR3C5]